MLCAGDLLSCQQGNTRESGDAMRVTRRIAVLPRLLVAGSFHSSDFCPSACFLEGDVIENMTDIIMVKWMVGARFRNPNVAKPENSEPP